MSSAIASVNRETAAPASQVIAAICSASESGGSFVVAAFSGRGARLRRWDRRKTRALSISAKPALMASSIRIRLESSGSFLPLSYCEMEPAGMSASRANAA